MNPVLEIQSGTSQDVRKLNTALILAAVMHKSPISLSGIGRVTGLSPRSVTTIALDLLRAGMLRVRQRGLAPAGRPPSCLNSIRVAPMLSVLTSGDKLLVVLMNSAPRPQPH